MIFRKLGIGVTSMVPTIFRGTRTSIFQFTVDPAGLREPPHLLLIDSTLCLEIRTQHQLLLMLKSSSIVVPVVAARVETQEVSTSLLTMRVSQTRPVSNTLPMIQITTQIFRNALLLISAKTAPGHHAQLDNPAKTSAGLLSTRSIMLLITTASLARTR